MCYKPVSPESQIFQNSYKRNLKENSIQVHYENIFNFQVNPKNPYSSTKLFLVFKNRLEGYDDSLKSCFHV